MRFRTRKRQKGMSLSLNQCFFCKKIKPCPYELLDVQKNPVCTDCINERRKKHYDLV